MNDSAFISPADAARVGAINAAIPGWSDVKQYAFFKGVLADYKIRDVLVLGVYMGRDIAYMMDIATRYYPTRPLWIIGVDKFNGGSCADWPEEKRALTWQAAGFGAPPDIEQARSNLAPFQSFFHLQAELHAADDAEFLEKRTAPYDFIYLDTDHTAQTVTRQLQQIQGVTREHTIIAGDDYSDAGTWGVKRAVTEGFREHKVFANWIWYSNRSELKTT